MRGGPKCGVRSAGAGLECRTEVLVAAGSGWVLGGGLPSVLSLAAIYVELVMATGTGI